MPPLLILFYAGIAVLAIIGFLYPLAARLRSDMDLHDLRVQCLSLRAEYARRLAILRGEVAPSDEDNFEFVDEIEAVPAAEFDAQKRTPGAGAPIRGRKAA